MPNSKKPADKSAEKPTDKKEEKIEQSSDEKVVGTSAQPKPPEPGSVGMQDGSKKDADELPAGTETNLQPGASVADGGKRIGMNDGTVAPLDDVPAGTKVIGEDTPRGDANDREPEPAPREGKLPAEMNATPTTDPVINGLFDPLQAGAPDQLTEDKAVQVNGVEVGGNEPDDELLQDIPVDAWPAVRACISRIEMARKHGSSQSLDKARADLNEALAPLDGGKGCNLRDWVNDLNAEIDAENDKAGRKELRDNKKAAEEAKAAEGK